MSFKQEGKGEVEKEWKRKRGDRWDEDICSNIFREQILDWGFLKQGNRRRLRGWLRELGGDPWKISNTAPK